jgi:hypothetical protein
MTLLTTLKTLHPALIAGSNHLVLELTSSAVYIISSGGLPSRFPISAAELTDDAIPPSWTCSLTIGPPRLSVRPPQVKTNTFLWEAVNDRDLGALIDYAHVVKELSGFHQLPFPTSVSTLLRDKGFSPPKTRWDL